MPKRYIPNWDYSFFWTNCSNKISANTCQEFKAIGFKDVYLIVLTNIWGNKIVTISIEFWSKSFVIYWIWSNFNVKRNRYNEITVCFIWAPWTWLHDFFVRAKEFIMFYHKITTKQLLNKIPHYHEEKTWQSLNSDHQIFRKFTRVQQIIISVPNLKHYRKASIRSQV